jgi:hypothetical protein
MPYSIEWHIPHHVVLVKIIVTLTADETPRLVEEMVTFRSETSETIHAIYDITRLEKLPRIGDMKNRTSSQVTNVGHLVILGKLNPLINFAVTTIAQLGNFRIRTANTLDESIRILCEVDVNLNRFLEQQRLSS